MRALLDVDAGAHVEEVLPALLPNDGADRALGWHLALGVLRHRGRVDAAIRPFLRQPLESLDAPVRAVLRVGVFEKLFARTAPHAAVDQAVELAKAIGVGRASGLVNAILRRAEPTASLSRADALDHPAWLIGRWDHRYGQDATERWCRANASPPPLSAVVRTGASTALTAAGLSCRPARAAGVEVPGVLRIDGHSGPVTSLPGFAEGRIWIQDAASAAVADLAEVGEGTRALDACAAPGGKSFRLADQGARVTSVDISSARLDLLRESARRLGIRVETRVHDWTRGPLPALGRFDIVLLDAPCTGLGTVRRHPEIRWRRVERDLDAAARRQRTILEHTSQHVAPGGALVYAVCSPEPEEGTDVVTAFLEAHPEFSLERTFASAPPSDDEDAFQAARLRKAP